MTCSRRVEPKIHQEPHPPWITPRESCAKLLRRRLAANDDHVETCSREPETEESHRTTCVPHPQRRRGVRRRRDAPTHTDCHPSAKSKFKTPRAAGSTRQ